LKGQTASPVQTGTIAGTVTDANTGSPIPGVNVVVEGTQQGAATNSEGLFEITDVEAGTYSLEASFVGYRTKRVDDVTVRAEETTSVSIGLQPTAIALDEVVAVGYGEQERADLTGSVTSVGGAELGETQSTSFDEALQGRLAGVRVVQSSGAPGAAPIVRIRGRTSIQGNNQPLYVIDGVPIGRGGEGGGTNNPLATISPSDIESIDVLKDASATAIYGSRGSNGVVLIQTKKGTAGTTRVSFSSSVGFSQVRDEEPMSASQWVQMANERAINGGIDRPFPNGVPEGAANTNWMDEITRTAMRQNYNLTISGGNEDRTYAIMGSYAEEEGAIINSLLDRGSFRFNYREDIGNLTIRPQLSLTRMRQDQRGEAGLIDDAFEAPPILAPFEDDGGPAPLSELNQYPFVDPLTRNPAVEPTLGTDETIQDRIFGNISLTYGVTDNIDVQIRGAIDKLDREDNQFTPTNEVTNESMNSAGKSVQEDTRWLTEGRITFNETLNDHGIDALAVASWEKEIDEAFASRVSGLPINSIGNRNLSIGQNVQAPETNVVDRVLISFLGRINYTYGDRYLVTFTGRRDGSSAFGSENRWGFFPSVAVGWRISEEQFVESVDWISSLKIRASWGRSGNQAIAPFQTIAALSTQDIAFNLERQVGLAPNRIPNPNLKWESTEQFNVGLDGTFLNDRLGLNLDAYYKETSDLLANVPIPLSSGFATTLRNIGTIRNRGIEVSVNADISTGDLRYSLGGNVSINRNKVKKLARGSDIITGADFLFNETSLAREGEPIGSFFGLKLDDPPLTENGLFNYVDQNDDGQVDSDDRVIIGNPHPGFVYGMNMSFGYGNLNASVLAQGEVGRDIFSIAKGRIGDSMHRGRNQIKDVFNNHWTQDNPDRNAEYPAANPNLNKTSSSWLVEDGSYLRIKNIRLSYSIPTDALNLPIESLSVFGRSNNLLVVTPYEFFDPDLQSTGGDALTIGVHDHTTYPFSRSFTFGLNAEI